METIVFQLILFGGGPFAQVFSYDFLNIFFVFFLVLSEVFGYFIETDFICY